MPSPALPRPIHLVLTLLLFGLAHPVTAAGAEPKITVELPVPQIREGESALYFVTIENTARPTQPRLEGFDDFDVKLVGERSIDSQRIIDINGRRQVDIRRGRQYQYALTPRRAGDLHIPAPMAEVDGQLLRGRDMVLRVIAQDNKGLAIPTITMDRPWVYPEQTFTVTLSVAVRSLPAPIDDRNPLSVQEEPPRLRIPWYIDDRLPRGVVAQGDLDRWLKPLVSPTSVGFTIDGIVGRRQQGYFLQTNESVVFLPPSEKIKRPDAQGKEVDFWQFRLARDFKAEKLGAYTFGPATITGRFAVAADEPGRARWEDVYAVAPSVSIEVRDSPLEGRPESYVGAMGASFQVAAHLIPTETRVGDPLTLTLALTGSGSLENTYAPDLALVPEIAENFKIHEATQDTTGNQRKFTYTVRPKNADVVEFPVVPVSYFDVDSERYITLETQPIPLQVSAAETLSAGDIVASPRGGGNGSRPVRSRSEGIFANVTDVVSVQNQSVRPVRWLMALLGLVGLYVIVAIGSAQVQRYRCDDTGRRRRAASGRARNRLEAAAVALQQGLHREGADQIQAAIAGLVADVADLPEAGLTPRDIQQQLTALNVEAALIERVDQLLATCDAAQYGSPDAAEGLGREARQTVERLLGSLKSQKRFR